MMKVPKDNSIPLNLSFSRTDLFEDASAHSSDGVHGMFWKDWPSQPPSHKYTSCHVDAWGNSCQ